jgi:hypothetical protein
MEVLQKAEMTLKTRPNLLPSLEPIIGVAGKGKPMKVFETNKPVKIM